MKKEMVYIGCCVQLNGRFIEELVDNSKPIKYETFLRKIGRDKKDFIEESLGYGEWLRMKNDHYVSYHSSKIDGTKFYYLVNSAIEYVFKEEDCHG